MLRMHFGAGQPVYHSGTWSWNNETDSLHFEPHTDLEDSKDRYIETNGYRFLRTLNAVEENVFRQEYTKSQPEYEVVVSINDVRDLVLFLMPKEFMRMRFVDFMHKPAVDKLLHALIIYFEYFLRMVEFVLIRRDEVEGSMSQIQSEQTNELKRICSIHLSQYRMLVARNYSVILKGEGDMAEFYHMKQSVHISATLKDRTFHKHFLAVAIQIVWITMHRRAYHVIEMEMNRLFGSEHFIGQHPEYIKFSVAERSLLYGRRNKIVNYRLQRSPLIQELEHVADEDLPILWIGERLYRGNNIRIASIELEYIVPDTQLRMIDVAHGILGNPKRFFNTILELNWPALRKENYSLTNDPYHLIRQPSLRVPNIKSRRDLKLFNNYEHFLKISQIYEPVPRHRLLKWLQRENKLSSSRIDDTPNIYTRCENELASKTIGPNVTQIIHNYFEIVTRFRKEITDDKNKDKESYASLRF